MPHYAWAEGETVVQINGIGPFDVIYVDPEGRSAQEVSDARDAGMSRTLHRAAAT